MKKSLSIYIMTTLGSLALVASIASYPVLSESNNKIVRNQFTTTLDTEDNSLNIDAINVSDDTWGEAAKRYEDTKGYIYTPNTLNSVTLVNGNRAPWTTNKEAWIVKLNAEGLTVNEKSVPHFSIQNVLFQWFESDGSRNLIPNLSAGDFSSSATKYDASNKTFKTPDTQTFNMVFSYGAKTLSKWSVKEIKSSSATPFIKINVPSYLYSGWGSETFWQKPIFGTGGFVVTSQKDYTTYWQDPWDVMHSSMKIWDASSSSVGPYAWGVQLYGSHSQQLIINTISDEFAKSDTRSEIGFQFYNTKISLFNDYKGGELKKTAIKKNGEVFNTVFEGMKIDETKLNKDLLPSASLDTINLSNFANLEGQDIAWNFVKDGKLSAVADDAAGTITISFMPAHIFKENEIIAYNGKPIEYTIKGFTLTNIFKIVGHPSDIVVDKWRELVMLDSGKIFDRVTLSKYLNLETVPKDADLFTDLHPSSDDKYDYAKGTVSFVIYSSKINSSTGTPINVKSQEFPITLQLTPRITTFTKVNDNPDNLTADLIKDKIFTDGKLNKTEFAKYQKITAPADNAEYYLVPGSYATHTGDGTVSFKLYANNYFDSKGQPDTGNANKTSSHFSFSFKVNRSPTVIEKLNFDSPIRVDKFIDHVSTGGVITADKLTTFNKYIKTENVPSNSVLSIDNVNIDNYDRTDDDYTSTDNRNGIAFDLILSEFNEVDKDGVVKPIKKTIPLTVGHLDAQHDGTDVVEITPVNPDRVDIFKKKIETLNDKELIAYLKHYVDFTSLREDAIVTADVVANSYDPYNGKIQLNIDIQNYYRKDNNDFDDTSAAFNNLSFDLPLAPTEVKVIKAKDLNVRLDRFIWELTTEEENIDEIDYIGKKTEVTKPDVLKQYVGIDVWDPKNTLWVETTSMDNSSGKWTGDLIMAEANDLNSDRVTNLHFPLTFTFAEKYAPTEIKQNSNYEPVLLDDFKDLLFDENGIAKNTIYDYIDIVSLPPDAQIKFVDEKIDYPNAQADITVEIASFYDKNSDLQGFEKTRTPEDSVRWIETFTFDLLSPATTIDAVEGYDATPRVDRFAANIKNLTNQDLIDGLANYVDFSYLPANTELRIDQTTFSVTNIPGTLKFNVLASRYFHDDGSLQITEKAFPITLNLANKYASTNITAKTTYIATHRVDRFIAELGASQTNPEITNFAVLNQYVDVISIPENAKLSIDYTKEIAPNKDTGELNFWIKTDKYYNNPDSDPKDDGFSFPITLQLDVVHQPTSIKEKPEGKYDSTIRVDRFLQTFMNTDNNMVTNRDVLEQYVDIVSLPPNAELYVSNANPNYKSGKITFNLIASQYYEATDSDLETDSITANKNPFPIELQLTPRADPTNFSARTDYSKDDILVNELTEYIAPNGVVNLERFQQYIDIVSLPSATKIELQEVSYSTTTGAIKYNVIVDQYYDANGDLQTKTATYPVSLQLNPVYAETKIEALSKYPTSLDITTFKNYVVDANGNVFVDNLQKFVSIQSLPPTSQLSIIWGDETATTIEFIVHASKYYNSQNRLADDKDFSIQLTLTGDVQTTNIVAWAEYPAIGAHQFFNLVNPNNKINYTQLNKYLDLSTVPHDADLSISKPVSNSKTGLVTFDITTSTWYDDNGVLQPTPKTFEIALQLTPKYPETYLFGIQSIDKNMTLEDFWAQISTYDVLDQVKLAQYVDLDTLVPNTKLQYLNPTKHFDGSISFDLVVDRYYDADGIENFGRKVFRIILSNLTINQQAKQTLDLTWLYVVIALLSTASIGLIWFLIAKNRKREENQNK